MAIICWGNLAKTANETQRIEQAIQEYIENHDMNPNAHMGEDYALGVHRLQAVMDHLPESVYPSHVNSDLTHIIQKEKDDDQAVIGDAEFFDLTDLLIEFNSGNIGKILMYCSIYVKVSGRDAHAIIRFKVTKDGVTTYYPSIYGTAIASPVSTDDNHTDSGSYTWSTDIPAGDISVQLQGARSTPDETVTFWGVNYAERCTLGVLSVGSLITE